MLQNAYFLAKIGADTAENEQHFAEILPKTGNYPTGPPDRSERRTASRPQRGGPRCGSPERYDDWLRRPMTVGGCQIRHTNQQVLQNFGKYDLKNANVVLNSRDFEKI